jgi:hypothetical protein
MMKKYCIEHGWAMSLSRQGKPMIIFSITALALVLGWQAYMTIMANTTEQQEYRVVEERGDVEIRFYPPAHRASVSVASQDGDYEFIRNRGFRELGGYIFGNNEANAQIAMTAPVVMDMDSTEQGLSGSMAFTMPRDFDMTTKPQPRSRFIAFTTTEAQYTASLRIGGFPSLPEMNTLFTLSDHNLPSGPINICFPFVGNSIVLQGTDSL